MNEWRNPGKKQQLFLLDRGVLTKLKAYAHETDQTFAKLVEPEFIEFEQALLKKCHQIDEIRYAALESARREKEQQELVAQYPLQVPGHPVDPIGTTA